MDDTLIATDPNIKQPDFPMEKTLHKNAVLLVDDDEEILEYLGHFLGEHFLVEKAANGRDALQVLKEHTIHLVVSDVMMPEMDGFELCRQIKTHIDYSHVPVLLLTAKNSLQAKIEGLEQGADVYVEKPFSPEYLFMQINSLLANRSRIRAYYAENPLAHLKSMANTRTDEAFLEQLNNVVLEHLGETELDVEHLARFLNMSRPTLYRKLKEITDLTPNEIINNVRLKRAAELLSLGRHSILEISYQVGYASSTHFSRNFHKRFGMLPSEYVKQEKSPGL
jgi:DNA-binding response OmpR family regulator